MRPIIPTDLVLVHQMIKSLEANQAIFDGRFDVIAFFTNVSQDQEY